MKAYIFKGKSVSRFSLRVSNKTQDFVLEPGKECSLPDCSYVRSLQAQSLLAPVPQKKQSQTKNDE